MEILLMTLVFLPVLVDIHMLTQFHELVLVHALMLNIRKGVLEYVLLVFMPIQSGVVLQ